MEGGVTDYAATSRTNQSQAIRGVQGAQGGETRGP